MRPNPDLKRLLRPPGRPPGPRRWPRWALHGLLVVTVLFGLWVLCCGQRRAKPPEPIEPIAMNLELPRSAGAEVYV